MSQIERIKTFGTYRVRGSGVELPHPIPGMTVSIYRIRCKILHDETLFNIRKKAAVAKRKVIGAEC
jgi:hypothetical protein